MNGHRPAAEWGRSLWRIAGVIFALRVLYAFVGVHDSCMDGARLIAIETDGNCFMHPE